MAFDPETKELARAHDAVDRLADIRNRIKEKREEGSKLHDVIIRGSILVLLAYVLGYAFERL